MSINNSIGHNLLLISTFWFQSVNRSTWINCQLNQTRNTDFWAFCGTDLRIKRKWTDRLSTKHLK